MRPKVAILREQGVNGQVEMRRSTAPASPRSTHMSDILAGGSTWTPQGPGGLRWLLRRCSAPARAGAKSILFNARARDGFQAFFALSDDAVPASATAAG
ncbi:phosphoribosylformylglycinamidine synthase subunit PurQ [Pseudomonas aeruginosa]|nr:phosphoribosylformylglycinamidine synthase subunit PurQ [Pseudomonas aeruginosa]